MGVAVAVLHLSTSSASANMVHRQTEHTAILYKECTAQNKTTTSARNPDGKHSSLKTVKKQVTRTFDNGLSTVNGTLSAETRELDIGRVEKDVRLLNWDDSDDSLSDSLSLEEAIGDYPRIAIDELASFLGFRFGDIQNSFEREALREQPQQPAIKSTASVAVKVRRNTPWIGNCCKM